MTVLSSSYGIIMYCAIHEPGHVNDVVDVINAMRGFYLKENMNFLLN